MAALEKTLVILLASLAFLLYSNSLWVSFILDDGHIIADNLFVKNVKYIPMFFKGYVTSSPIPRGMCRPLLMLTFLFNYLTGGLNPTGYHILNITLHFLNATLIYSLLKLLRKGAPLGLIFIICILFLAHPINTEAVTYLSSRSDLLVTFFVLSSFIFYLKNRYLWSSASFIFALLSKETGLSLLFLLFGYHIFYQYGAEENTHKKKLFFVTTLIIFLGYLFYNKYCFGGFQVERLRPLFSNILIQSWVSFFYLKLFLFPFSLNIFHWSPNLGSLLQPESIMAASGIVSLLILIIALRKKQPLISLGIFWYIIFLLPKFYATLHFVNCEHHFYLAGIGAYIILASALTKLYLKNTRYFFYPAIGIICTFSLLTWFRNYEWSDTLRLWKASAERNPGSAPAHNFLGLEYAKRQSYEKAEEELRKALILAEDIRDKTNAIGNLAALYRIQGNYEKALETLRPLLNMPSPPPNIYQNLGVIYMGMKKEKEAVSAWEKELRFYPANTLTYINLGLYYLRKKEIEKAKNYFEKAIHYNPDHYLGYYYLGLAYEEDKNIKKAAELYKESIRINPKQYQAYYAIERLNAPVPAEN